MPVASRKRGIKEIPLTLEIPASALTILPVDGKYAAKVELRLAATDEHGNQSGVPLIDVELTSPVPPAMGQHVRYTTRILLRGKARHVVAVVHDLLSGRIAAGEAILGRN